MFKWVVAAVVVSLIASMDSGTGALASWRDLPDPHGPRQAWGSAQDRGKSGHVKSGNRNQKEPKSLRSRYPLTTVKQQAAPPQRNTAQVVTPPESDEEVAGYDAKTSRELPERRDAHTRTFANADGTLSTEVAPRPINYRRPDGSWAPIDTRVVPVGATRDADGVPAQGWRNVADSVDVRLAPRTGTGPLVRMGLGGGQEVAYSLQAAGAADGREGERGVTYPGVLPHTDVKLDVGSGGVKETIVLRSPEAPRTFVFPLQIKGLTAKVDGEQVVFIDSAGQVKATVPAGHMTDSAAEPATSTKVSYRLVSAGGRPALQVSVDQEWLTDPARRFPVMVDPSVEITAAGTSMTVNSGGSIGGGQELSIGSRSAAYLAFPQLNDKLKNHRIFGASLWMLNYDSATCRSRPVTVHPATEAWVGQSGLSYPGPSIGRSLARKSFSYGHIAFGATKSRCPTNDVAFNLGKDGRDLVQRWVNGQQANYGLSVRDDSSDSLGAKKFTGHDTANPPRLIVTHSPYNASYAIPNPVPNPPVTQAQNGKVKVTVTNTGAQAWSPGAYYLAYRVYNTKGKLVTQQRSADLTVNVARGAKTTFDAIIKPLPPGTYSIDFTMVKTGGPVFTDEQVPPIRLIIKIIDIPPVLQELYPPNGYQAPTLTPQLWATAVDLDAPTGSALSYKYEVCEKRPDGSAANCFDSGYVPTHAWTVQAGKLSWAKTYLWRVFVKDTGNEVPSPRVMLQTSVPQPEITSRLTGVGDREFDPQTGNYGTSAVDASVAGVGPELTLERTYNSLDPRRDSPFGAGWTTQFDMRLTEDADGSGNVVIGYPDGQQVRYGKNPDGTYAAPSGRYATLTVASGRWKLTDKTGRAFEFVDTRLVKITDPNGQALTLTYDPLTGKLSRASAAGGRYLSFTWSGTRVSSVSTNPVDGKTLSWSYTYTGDLLTKVCAPGDRCTTYEYGTGSHYRSTVLDDRPESYWRLGEDEPGTAGSQFAINLGKDAGTYKNVTLKAPGVLAGTDNTAATFNGTTSHVTLPPGTVKKSRDIALEVWFKNNPTGAGGPLIGYQDKPLEGTSTVGVPALYTGTDGLLRGQFWSGGTISPITSTKRVNDGQWHHAVLTAMGSTQTLYLDGVAVGTLTNQTPNHLNLTHNQLGAAYTPSPASWPGWGTAQRRFYNGTIDEVAIYHHPLGPAQVAAHHREALRQSDQLTKVTLPSGKIAAEIDYDTAWDRVSEYTDGNGGTWKLQPPTVYGGDTDLRRAVEVRDPADRPYLYENDALTGNIIRVGMPMGLETREEDRTQPTATPTPSPTFTCTKPDPGDPSFCTTPPGNPGDVPDFIPIRLEGMVIRTFDYDDRGFPTKITNENGEAVQLTHDDRGNVLTRKTCRSPGVCHTAYYTYPAVTNPADPRNDQPTEYRDGRSTSPTDGRYRTGYGYTTTGQLQTRTNPDGGGTDRYTYTNGLEPAVDGGQVPPGLLLTETDPRNAVTRYRYTSAGDLAETTDPTGMVTKHTYDGIGRLKSTTEVSDTYPAGVTTGYGYDDLSNLTSVTGPLTTNAITGAQQQQRLDHTYDVDGNLVKDQVSDAAGGGDPRVTTYDYDPYNRVEKVTDAHDHETNYDYDRFGNVTAMVDAADNHFQYAYTSRNSLAEVRLHDFDGDPEGAPDSGDHLVVNRYFYDYAGRLASDIDAMGRKVDYTYYGDGLPKSAILRDFRDSDGTKRDFVLSTVEYDGAGNPTEQTTANGRTIVQNVYDRVGRVESTTLDPGRLNRRVSYQYDAGGNVTKVIRSGNPSNVPWPTPAVTESTDYTYDGPGRMTAETVTDGSATRVTGYTYDQRDLLTAVTDPRGNVAGADKAAFTTTYTNDELGRPIKTSSPPVQVEKNGGQPATVHPETVTGYNAFDEQTEAKDPNGNISRTEYDRLGQPVKHVAPAYTPPGSSTSLVPTTVTHYDPLGRVSKVVDPRQNDVRYGYDRLGRIHTVDAPYTSNDDRVQWRYTHTRTGEILSSTDPSGARTEYTYDDLSRPVTHTQIERRPAPAAYTSRADYDDASNLLTATSPTGATTTSTYDTLDQLTRTVDAAGIGTQVGYDHAGRQIRLSDGLNRTTRLSYDLFGDLVGRADMKPDGTVLRERSAAYDPVGNPTRTTDALGRSTTFQYDASSRLVKQVEPVSDTESITTTFGYDAAGNRTRFTDGRGNTTVYTINTLGLGESTIEPATTAHPLPSDRTWITSYDEAGNPVELTSPGGITRRRTFDPAQRLLTETGSGTSSPSAERTYGYDTAGRLIKAGSAAGTDLFRYSDRGLLLSAEGPSGAASWAYNGDGQMTGRTDAAGTASFGYARGRITTVQDGITGTTQTIGYNLAGQPDEIDYGAGRLRSTGYDDLGRPVTDTLKSGTGNVAASISYDYDDNDRLTGKTTVGLAGAGEQTYGYDHAGRLTSWSRNGTETRYEWDAAGNRTKNGGIGATYDERNRRLTDGGDAFSYTPRGTIAGHTGGDSRTDYTFDAFDRLVSAGDTSYTYDALDRVATRDGISLSYAGLEKDPVRDGANGYARAPSGGLLATGGAAGARIMLADRRGDVVGGFAPDSALGSVTDSTAYEPFGQPVARTGVAPGVGYQGDWTDPGTGQVNMHARWYEPKAGAFINRDDWDLDPAGGSIAANRYTYANGDPVNVTDPTGHCPAAGLLSPVTAVPAGAACGGTAAGPPGALAGGLLAGIGIGGYYAYRWWRGRSSGSQGSIPSYGLPSWLFSSGGCTSMICRSPSGGGGGGYRPVPGGRGVYYPPGWGGGPSAAQLAAIARARAIAAARARTAAAKKRAARDARTNPRKIDSALRRPQYAVPRDRISSGRSVRPRTPHSRNVVKDTVRSLWDIHAAAVSAAGEVVGEVSLAATAPTDGRPVTSPGGAGGIGGGGAGTILADPPGEDGGILLFNPGSGSEAVGLAPDRTQHRFSRLSGGSSGVLGSVPKSDLEQRRDDCLDGKTAKRHINYWPLDKMVGPPGRAQGADACLIGWPGTPTDPRITPMGWRSGYERGHLVGSQLGGPETNRERRNFVPLTPSANSAMSHGVEKEVADRLRRKERIFYVVVPEYYNKGNHVPKKVDVLWWSSSGAGAEEPYYNVP
ncbi:LamG-like jellyroll fold domain-containing protein [Actinomadura viridis]|uniref:LamG-like jellyroll fold domain-containing protein n=1 Tax=Actinomadura viridis TaxID=58110 RepID=UPI0036CD2EE6